jgi:hypothetical protein
MPCYVADSPLPVHGEERVLATSLTTLQGSGEQEKYFLTHSPRGNLQLCYPSQESKQLRMYPELKETNQESWN